MKPRQDEIAPVFFKRNLFIVMIAFGSLFPKTAKAVTEHEAKDIADSVFTRHFGAHYLNDVLFYDGTEFRLAWAAARSGATDVGGCGFTLTNASIGVTFDMATDSVGADDEGMTVLKIDTASYPTLDSLQNTLEDFVYENITGSVGFRNTSDPIFMSCFLEQNYPNPFNPTTVISYRLAVSHDVTLKIYNLLGQEVRTLIEDRFHMAGKYSITWDGRDNTGRLVSSNIYVYQLRTRGFTKSRTMILMR